MSKDRFKSIKSVFIKCCVVVSCVGFSLLLTACSNKSADKENTAASSASVAPAAVIIRDGVTFAADPDPVMGDGPVKLGKTTLSWKTPVKSVQIRLGAPDGKLFAISGGAQQAETGYWVANGMTFYLQDNTALNPTDPSATLAKLAVSVK
ncbi:MAG TPA: hypothetical protein VG168_06585 [Bryobacteraceae bacterium]|nr:hypothetical protein [Bryobacteraceae bacterium]